MKKQMNEGVSIEEVIKQLESDPFEIGYRISSGRWREVVNPGLPTEVRV